MTDRIDGAGFARMIQAAAGRIREKHLWLSELDSFSGDGDHGTTMLRVVDRLERAFTPDRGFGFRVCFEQAGWNVLDADGGAASALLGSFFLGMADAVAPDVWSLECLTLAAALDSGVRGLRQQTDALPGDKTLMDALLPAVKAFSEAANCGRGMEEALKRASDSATCGAQATAAMVARYGRARLLGEKTRGHPDPGATSVALMFEGFYAAWVESRGECKHGRC